MKYDAKLKHCAEEIKKILAMYDVMATVSLVSKTHGEFVMHFPTWSGIQLEDGHFRIRFKKEEQEKAEATTHIIVSTVQINEMFIQNFGLAFNELKKKSLIGMSPLSVTPHEDSGWDPSG